MDAAASDADFADVVAGEPVRSLDPSIRTVWMIKMAGVSVLFFLPVLFYDLTYLFSPDPSLPFGVLSGTLLVGATLYCIAWPRLRYRSWGFVLRPEEVYMEHGVLQHVRTIVPLRRIQHVDVSQDLIEREFALGRLVVHTAGSRSSDVVIPGLPLSKAEALRDKIKRFILEDPLIEEPV